MIWFQSEEDRIESNRNPLKTQKSLITLWLRNPVACGLTWSQSSSRSWCAHITSTFWISCCSFVWFCLITTEHWNEINLFHVTQCQRATGSVTGMAIHLLPPPLFSTCLIEIPVITTTTTTISMTCRWLEAITSCLFAAKHPDSFNLLV